MADSKISDLSDGSPLVGSTDYFVIARSGANYKISASAIGGVWERQTSNHTATIGDQILCDTTGGTFTLTLPASPSANAAVTIKSGPSAATNALTIGRNSQTINGVAADMTITQNRVQITFVFDGTTWQT